MKVLLPLQNELNVMCVPVERGKRVEGCDLDYNGFQLLYDVNGKCGAWD